MLCLDYAAVMTDGQVKSDDLARLAPHMEEVVPQDEPSNKWSTLLVGAHAGTSLPLALAVEKKGAEGIPSAPGYVVRCVTNFCEQLCLSTIEVVTDGEPAILELAEAVRSARLPLITRLRTAPAHSKGPVGPADAAIKVIGGQIRTMKLALEEKYATRIDTGWTIFPWLVRHSSWLVARFAVRACGQTSYQQAFDSVFQGEVAPHRRASSVARSSLCVRSHGA